MTDEGKLRVVMSISGKFKFFLIIIFVFERNGHTYLLFFLIFWHFGITVQLYRRYTDDNYTVIIIIIIVSGQMKSHLVATSF